MRDPHLHAALSGRGLLLLPVAMLGPLLASMIGSLFTVPQLAGWYRALNKPFFTPPDMVFPLVWTFLYALMAVSFWRILRAKPEMGSRKIAILAFVVQLLLNVAWSYAFFARQSPLMGLVVIGALIIAIVINIRTFLTIDRAAGYALYLYLAWVSFATLLNVAIVFLNR